MLRSRFPRVDDAIIADGVVDAIMEYCRRPPSREDLSTDAVEHLLSVAAWRNVANLIRAERRRLRREAIACGSDGSFVAMCGRDRERGHHAAVTLDHLARNLPTEADRRVLRLRAEGVRATAAFANALGVSHLPANDQASYVNRAKDRVMKLLRRRCASDPGRVSTAAFSDRGVSSSTRRSRARDSGDRPCPFGKRA